MNPETAEDRAFKLVTDWLVRQGRPCGLYQPDMDVMATLCEAANMPEDAAGYRYAEAHLDEVVHKVITTQNIRELREQWATLLAESRDLLQSSSDLES